MIVVFSRIWCRNYVSLTISTLCLSILLFDFGVHGCARKCHCSSGSCQFALDYLSDDVELNKQPQATTPTQTVLDASSLCHASQGLGLLQHPKTAPAFQVPWLHDDSHNTLGIASRLRPQQGDVLSWQDASQFAGSADAIPVSYGGQTTDSQLELLTAVTSMRTQQFGNHDVPHRTTLAQLQRGFTDDVSSANAIGQLSSADMAPMLAAEHERQQNEQHHIEVQRSSFLGPPQNSGSGMKFASFEKPMPLTSTAQAQTHFQDVGILGQFQPFAERASHEELEGVERGTQPDALKLFPMFDVGSASDSRSGQMQEAGNSDSGGGVLLQDINLRQDDVPPILLKPEEVGRVPSVQWSSDSSPQHDRQFREQFDNAHRIGKALDSENLVLPQELVNWHHTAGRIMDREANVAAEVADLRKSQIADEQNVNDTRDQKQAQIGLSLRTFAKSSQPYNVRGLHISNGAFALVMLFFGVNAITFTAWYVCGRSQQDKPHDIVRVVPYALRRAARSACKTSLWQGGGGKEHDRNVEITGIRVGNFHSDRDVYVSFQLGVGEEMCSRMGKTCGNGPLCFSDSFSLEIASSAPHGKCICRVYEQDEEIARLEIPIQELLRFSQTQGYFTLDLIERLPRTRQNPSRAIPYVAAKAQDVVAP